MTPSLLIDSHAHLTSHQVFDDVDALLTRAQKAGVGAVINICTDVDTLEKGLTLQSRYDWVFNAAATTPHDVAKEGEEVFPLIEKSALRGELVAVGETGLDYHYEHSARDIQKRFLRKYLHLALACHLPVVIHCRDAFADFFEILDAEYTIKGKHAPGVLHCFTGTLEEAEQVIKRDWFLSLSGIVTFKKSTVLQEVARQMPLKHLLIETDTPYLAPQAHRGKVNEPAFVREVAELIAFVKKVSVEEVIQATADNAKRLFNLH